MFQEIKLNCIAQTKPKINKAFISNNKTVVLLTSTRSIIIFHQDNPLQQIYLQKEISFTFRKIKEIKQIQVLQPQQTYLLFLIDQTLCIVKLIQSKGSQNMPNIILKWIRIINVLDDNQLPKDKRMGIYLIEATHQQIMLYVNIYNEEIRVLSYSLSESENQINMQKQFNSRLTFRDSQNQTVIVKSIVQCKVKKINDILIIFDQNTEPQALNSLLLVDLKTGLEQNNLMIKSIYQLPELTYKCILKDIHIIVNQQEFQKSSLLLFFQFPTYLQISQIILNNSTIILKEIRHPGLVLYQVLSDSIKPHLIDVKGENYCKDTLTFLVHARYGLNSKDKLMIIGSPTSHKMICCINEIDLPSDILHFCESKGNHYVVCSQAVFEIVLIPKSQIYQNMLQQMSAQCIQRIIYEILD